MNFHDLLPDPHDPLMAPHWQALREGHLKVQQCDRCSYLRWQPASICPECLAGECHWTEIEAAGKLWSFTVYHRALHPAFKQRVPYVVGLVELDSGVQMIGAVAAPDAEIHIGMRLRANYWPASDDFTLIEWVPFLKENEHDL